MLKGARMPSRNLLSMLRAAVLLCFATLMLVGCYSAKMAPPPPPPPPSPPSSYSSGGSYDSYASESEMAYASEPRGRRSMDSAQSKSSSGASAPSPVTDDSSAAPPPKAKRKIHYAGYASLRVVSVEESTDTLTALAKELGGFVESVSGRVVTLRVPVDRFQSGFDQVTELGELLDRSITARDVTEAFMAVDLRLSTAKRTRDRLVELLARAEDEEEKLALIAQIQRVTEDIDRMESQLRTLDSMSKLSRITVELVPREAQAWQDADDETAEMAWIRALSPFKPDLVSEGKRHDIAVPDGMVQLTPKRRFIAEGPDGSRVWTGRLANEPQGDSQFWSSAVKARLAEQFQSTQIEQLGGYTLVRLTDRGDAPYTWWIAVRADESGRWIDVVEAYFPTPEELERFGPAVRASLKSSGGAS